MDQLYIFMEHEYFGYHWLNLVHSWVRVIIECSQTHVFEDIEQNNQGEQVAVESYSCETPIHARTQEDIYDIMAQGYKINYDRLSAPKNKPIATGDNRLPVYKDGCKWNGIDHRRVELCQLDTVKLDGMNK